MRRSTADVGGPSSGTASSGSIAASTPPARQRDAGWHRPFDQGQRDRAGLVVVGHGTDPTDGAALGGEHRVARPRAGCRPSRPGAAAPAGAAAGRGCAPGRPSPGRGSSPCPGAPRCPASGPRSGWSARRCPPRGAGAAAIRSAADRPTAGRAGPGGDQPGGQRSPRSARGTAISMPSAGPADESVRSRRCRADVAGTGSPAARAVVVAVGPTRATSARSAIAGLDVGPEPHRLQVAQQSRRRDRLRCPGRLTPPSSVTRRWCST